MTDCIFCKIIKGEVPCPKIYEDEHTFVMLDARPATSKGGHSLVMPKKHYELITDIPDDEPVDLAVFVIPPPGVRVTMEDCIQKGVKAGVVITAGFAEIGPEGKKLQDALLEIARKGPLRFIGPGIHPVHMKVARSLGLSSPTRGIRFALLSTAPLMKM